MSDQNLPENTASPNETPETSPDVKLESDPGTGLVLPSTLATDPTAMTETKVEEPESSEPKLEDPEGPIEPAATTETETKAEEPEPSETESSEPRTEEPSTATAQKRVVHLHTVSTIGRKLPWNPSTSIHALGVRNSDGPGIHGGLIRAKKVYGNAFPKQRLEESVDPNCSMKGRKLGKKAASSCDGSVVGVPREREQVPRPSTYEHVSPSTGFTSNKAGMRKADFESTYGRTTLIGNWQEDKVLPKRSNVSSGKDASLKLDRLNRGNVLGTSPGITYLKLEESDLKRVSHRHTPRGVHPASKARKPPLVAKMIPSTRTTTQDSEALRALVRKPRLPSNHRAGADHFWHISSIYHSDFEWPNAARDSIYNNK